MAGRTPAQRTSEALQKGRLPPSPCGATPRPPLRQVYPKVSFMSESQLNTSIEGDYSQVTTNTSYTLLRSSRNGVDTVDSPDDYADEPVVVGSSTKSIVILALIFFLTLLAVAWIYKSKENLVSMQHVSSQPEK